MVAASKRAHTVDDGEQFMRFFRPALAAILLPALLAAGCGGDDGPEPLPEPTESSSNTSSDEPSDDPSNGDKPSDDQQPPPPPKGIKLSNSEQAAYDAARKDYDKWSDIAAKLNAKGEATKKAYQTVARYTFNPFGEEFYETLQKLDKAGVHIVRGNESRIRWEVPVKVDLDARMNGNPAPVVVWKRCFVVGDDYRVMHGDKEIKQPKKNERSVSRIEVRGDDTGYWRATKAKVVGHRC